MNIKLRNVRLSFPSLFKPSAFDDKQEPKFGATFILDSVKNAEDIKAVRAAINSVAAEAFKKVPPGLKTCLRNGSEKEHLDGYGEGTMFIPTSAQRRPVVVARDLSPLTEDDNVIYAGCYVNASIRVWPQDNQFGRRVNAQLRGVQFVRDGDPFGEKPLDPEEEFDQLDAGGEDDTGML